MTHLACMSGQAMYRKRGKLVLGPCLFYDMGIDHTLSVERGRQGLLLDGEPLCCNGQEAVTAQYQPGAEEQPELHE